MKKEIIVLGSDKRSCYLKEELERETGALGADHIFLMDKSSAKAAESVKHCHMLILPVNYMGERCVKGCEIPVDDLLDSLNSCGYLVGGLFTQKQKEVCSAKGIRVLELLKDEAFNSKNAYLTAESAIGYAITAGDGSMLGSTCTIIGSGRIAKALAHLLRPFTPMIRVAARSEPERTRFEMEGICSYPICEMSWALYGAHYVFNTVPEPIITKDALRGVSKGCIYLELASAPYGCKKEDCETYAQWHLASGLPAKICPRAAAHAAVECILNRIEGD